MLAAALAALEEDDSSTSLKGEFTDKYDVERVIGRGGMGTVFEARHKRLGHRVAIKVLGNELRAHPELVKRFEREARAAGSLTSPHAARVFDIDQTKDGTPFIVMELLSGSDLGRVIEAEGPRPVGAAVRWIIEACDAIAEAHRLGIIHRDIKPSNLLLDDTGHIKVLDFGIAKRVPTRGVQREAAITLGVAPLGTPQYMSPEQVRCAKDVDSRTDIWSLGVTLYELVTGRPPYNHDIAQACVAAIVADPVPDPREFTPDLPAELAAALLRALAKDPDERFATVEDFVQAISPHAADADEEPSWRVISGAHRAFGEHLPTLDGDDENSDVVLPLRRAGRISASNEDNKTVPPTVSRRTTLTASHGRRVRSSIAFASAAVLGLVALVATPKCVGSHVTSQVAVQAAVNPAAIAPPHDSHNSPTTTTPTTTRVAVNERNDLNNSASGAPAAIEVDEAAAPPAPKAVVRASSSSATTTKPLRPVVIPRQQQPVRVIGSERPVHGGISNPGF